MKAYEVISAGACSNQARFSGLESKKGRHTYNGMVIRAIMKDGMGFCEQDIQAAIDQYMNPDVFNSTREYNINTQVLIDRMMRFQKWLKNQEEAHTVYVPAGEATVQGVEVSFDLIVKTGIDVRVFKIKNKKNDELTWRGKKRIDESMEMFLLQLVGEQMFPNSSASGCIAFLRDKDDTASNFVDPINYAGVIQHHFLDSGRWMMEDRLKEILNGTMNYKCGDCGSCPYVNLCTQKAKEAPLAVVPPQPKATGPVRFTPSQMELINADHGVFRVLAGAGSGKTTCIANRICRLVDSCHPKKILLITYTTKGVEEMREKIQYWMAENGQTQYDIDDFNIFTFNGFGNEIIKQNYADFGFSAEPRLIEKPEEMQLIQELLDKSPEIPGYDYANPLMNFHQQFMPLESGRGVCVVMSEYFKKLKSSYCASEEDVAYLLSVPVDIAIRVFNLFMQYQNELAARNLVDYQDQISMCYDFYSHDKNLKAHGFEHIIVDEFQDSNLDQINLLFRLNQYPYIESLMVVGDDSQAIFEFRGANSDGIINFHQWFDAEDIDLCENFRSTREICHLANHVNDINTRKVPKKLISSRRGEAVSLVGAATEQVFMDQVIADIKARNIAPHDVAIMSRNRSELMKFKDALDAAGIPSIIAASELLVEHADTKVVVNFFRFLMNPQESLYYAEFLKLQNSDEFNQNLYQFSTWFQQKKKAFLDAYFKLHTDSDKIDFIFGILDDIAADNRVVSSLLNLLRGRNLRSVRSISKFLDNMMLYNADYPIERPNVPVEAVTITTAHSSKGKEWNHCYLYLNKFKYPGASDYCIKKNRADFEAERRLLFVAITRAKDTLMIGGATRSSIYTEIQDGI